MRLTSQDYELRGFKVRKQKSAYMKEIKSQKTPMALNVSYHALVDQFRSISPTKYKSRFNDTYPNTQSMMTGTKPTSFPPPPPKETVPRPVKLDSILEKPCGWICSSFAPPSTVFGCSLADSNASSSAGLEQLLSFMCTSSDLASNKQVGGDDAHVSKQGLFLANTFCIILVIKDIFDSFNTI